MTKKLEGLHVRTVLAASISLIGMSLAGVARADEAADEIHRQLRPDSEIEIGVGNVSADSYKYGDYRGLGEQGSHLIGNIHVIKRGENDARYLEIKGRNLGLDSRNIQVEGGEQGNYRLRLEYDQLPKLYSDSYQTPFLNPGNTTVTLPGGWVEANNTGGMTQLNANMRPFDVKSMRKTWSLGITKLLPANWEVSVDFKREHKDGNRFIGATFGTGGGNPRAVMLPEPLDYTTDQFEATARYTTAQLQLQFGYYGSFFRNSNQSLTWQNPYANAAGTIWGIPAVGYSGGGYGQLSLPPDNQFHQINAAAGYNISKETRLAGSVSVGRMTQDESFLPYSVNPALTVTTPMPRSSLDGRINTTHADLKLTSKLMPKLQFTAAYRYDDRDNKTPQSQYIYIAGDSQNQQGLASAYARTNLPTSSTKQQLQAEFDYRLAARTKLKFGYEYDWVKKTFEPITDERENTLHAAIDHHFGESTSGGISYSRSARRTSNYNGAAPVLASYSAAYLGTLAANLRWDDLPGMKKFFLASRDRNKLRAFANVSATERLDLQFGINYHKDDYPDSEFGLKEATGWMANFDANFQATEAVSSHLFLTLEKYGTDQNSRAYSGGALKAAQSADPNRNWSMSADDRTTTFGLGFRVKPEGKYEYGGDVSNAYSKGSMDFSNGTALVGRSLPNLTTRLSRLELFGRYWLQRDLSLNLRYIHERYRSADWAYDQVLPNTLAAVIGTNQTSPDYSVNVLSVSVAYRFR